MNRWIYCWFFGLLLVSGNILAQTESLNSLETDSIPDLQIELEKKGGDDKKKKEVKGKKNVYYGKKVRKSFVKNGSYIEIFHYLREYEEPNKYIDEIAWLYPEKRAIYLTEYNKIKKPSAKILHGPYERRQGDKVIETGFYYIGTKHGRWEKFGRDAMDRDHVLIDKTKYFRGWQKESVREYYDLKQTKLKEVIPVKNGKKNGTYYYYFENGFLGMKGDYEEDVKIGRWMEYYENGQRKKETQYAKDALDTEFKPYTLREWDTKGKVKEYKNNGEGY